MNSNALIDSLDRLRALLPSLVNAISIDDARWKPDPEHWSILEIVRHLGDEEVDDFRTRLRLTIEDSSQPWPGIDPEGWAVQRRYNEGDLNEAVERFVREREASVQWLRTLNNVDWSVAHHHPKIGPIRAGDLLAAWAAHDALHLRQIAKRLFQLTERNGGEYSTRYAGEW